MVTVLEQVLWWQWWWLLVLPERVQRVLLVWWLARRFSHWPQRQRQLLFLQPFVSSVRVVTVLERVV